MFLRGRPKLLIRSVHARSNALTTSPKTSHPTAVWAFLLILTYRENNKLGCHQFRTNRNKNLAFCEWFYKVNHFWNLSQTTFCFLKTLPKFVIVFFSSTNVQNVSNDYASNDKQKQKRSFYLADILVIMYAAIMSPNKKKNGIIKHGKRQNCDWRMISNLAFLTNLNAETIKSCAHLAEGCSRIRKATDLYLSTFHCFT